jgi:hypothetical protein
MQQQKGHSISHQLDMQKWLSSPAAVVLPKKSHVILASLGINIMIEIESWQGKKVRAV